MSIYIGSDSDVYLHRVWFCVRDPASGESELKNAARALEIIIAIRETVRSSLYRSGVVDNSEGRLEGSEEVVAIEMVTRSQQGHGGWQTMSLARFFSAKSASFVFGLNLRSSFSTRTSIDHSTILPFLTFRN